MAKQIIFSDTILYSEYKNPELHNKIKNILDEEVSKDNNNQKSNAGGFQSFPIKDIEILNNLADNSSKLIQENYKFKKETHMTIESAWINQNKRNHYNKPHIHDKSNFSGIYYIETPSVGGNLVFIRNDISADLVGNDYFIEDNFFSRWEVKPTKNLLILFPANLLHLVEPHFEDKSRISIAFNIKFHHG